MSETTNSTPKALGGLRIWQVILALVPLGVAFLLSLYALAIDEESRQEQVYLDLDHQLQETLRNATSEKYFPWRLRRFAALTLAPRLSSEKLVRLWQAAQKRWMVEFEPYWFDAEGRLVTPGSIPIRQPQLIAKIWKSLRTDPGMLQPGSEALKKEMETWFGFDFQMARVKEQKRRVFSVIFKGVEGLAFWDADSRPGIGGIFCVIRQKPTELQLLRNIVHLNRSLPRLVALERSGGLTFLNRLPDKSAFRREILNRFLLARERYVVLGNRLWAKAGSGSPSLIGGLADPRLDHQLLRWRVYTFFLFLAPTILIFLYARFFAPGTAFFSIRWKLIFLFLFALAIPLSGVSLLGLRTLQDRQSVILADGLRTAGDLLARLDADFTQESVQYLKLFRETRDLVRPEVPVASLVPKFDALRNQKRMARFEIHDINGSATLLLDSTSFDRGRAMFDAFAKLCMDRQLSDRLAGRERPPLKQEELVMRMMVESPEMGFLFISDRPNRIHELKFGNYHTFLYWDVFKDPLHPSAFIALVQLVRHVFEEFLRLRLTTNDQRLPQGFTLMARHNQSNRWFPDNAKPDRVLKNLMDKARSMNQGLGERVTIDGIKHLAFAFPGLNLDGYTLVAIQPETIVLSGLQWLRILIFSGFLLAILLTILVSFVISDMFLYPISELSRGIMALRERDTSYRIPDLPKDELGDLGQTFNRMIGGLKEMELARVVQEALLPEKTPDIGGYDIALTIKMASDLGGDYCDILPLKDGKFLMVIGDVTGHGVSSALLVAMAKAIVFRFSQGEGKICNLLERLNHLIFKLLKKKKMMTFFATFLDPATGQVRCTNAGHPYPVYSYQDGRARMLENINLPLGSTGKKLVYKEEVLEMAPGDAIVFYTDGLVEAVDQNQMPFGYQRLMELIKMHGHRSSKEIIRHLLEDFQQHHPSPTLEDDITLMVIKRNN